MYFEDLPDEVVKETKRSVLDYLGIVLAVSQAESSKILIALLREFCEKRESTIIGEGAMFTAPNAALANVASGHVLELDDDHKFTNTHLGITSLPFFTTMRVISPIIV